MNIETVHTTEVCHIRHGCKCPGDIDNPTAFPVMYSTGAVMTILYPARVKATLEHLGGTVMASQTLASIEELVDCTPLRSNNK